MPARSCPLATTHQRAASSPGRRRLPDRRVRFLMVEAAVERPPADTAAARLAARGVRPRMVSAKRSWPPGCGRFPAPAPIAAAAMAAWLAARRVRPRSVSAKRSWPPGCGRFPAPTAVFTDGGGGLINGGAEEAINCQFAGDGGGVVNGSAEEAIRRLFGDDAE
ncbi:hypothetical protein ACP70R_031730 [Stipagrostis hirtigluma subsp. patula]